MAVEELDAQVGEVGRKEGRKRGGEVELTLSLCPLSLSMISE